MLTVEMGDSSEYSCAYWVLRASREIPSRESPPVPVAVIGPLPVPQLTASPAHPVYVVGEAMALTCSIPGAPTLATVQFSKDGGELPSPLLNDSPTLQLASIGTGHAGTYSCWYQRWESGREISSPPSGAVAISVLDPPRKPSVSLSPDYPAYVAGDRVEINCSAPPGASPVQYGLYEIGEPLGSLTGNAGIWWMDLEANNTRNSTWSFSCAYIELIQGRALTSHASDPVSVSVLPAPAAPSLWLIPPLPLYVTGETVTAECVVPAGPFVPRAHWVLRDGEALREPPGPQLPLNVTPSDSGTYRCGYSTELHGRHLRSPPSDPVPLSVTDPPPQPVLSMDPPSGVVSEGLPVLITCAAPGDANERRFHFYKDGAEIIPGDAGSEISTTEPSTGSMNFSVLSILRASPSNTGEFSCGYEVNMSGRWIPSPRSQALNVTGNFTVTAQCVTFPLARDLAVGGSFFVINTLIFFITHRCC
ncbi:basement membrane-specific heparan sulfate proteoglycan core protein-like isoform X2 [Mauremys reevesii]|uniref:basement membrane-specific heparan sulfate proteoglycan core protein-like isoform X2 n=1 Tax=Mauremys reevesii TaxID=260615 RepID=UPI00193F4AFF|nr:basement membrane-specific heparan sulfate proteoglycan core protein-like isoform X2 [Mauremys reevesii]